MTPTRVLLADDHTLVRAGIRSLLESIDGVEVVAECEEGREALEAIRKLRPDVALLDISMPGLNGLEVADRVAKESPKTRVIILSMHADQGHVTRALRAGVSGYLLKGAAVGELPEALKAVIRGARYVTPKVSRFVTEGRSDTEAGPLDELPARQREILQLIAEGHSTREIAARLELSVKTVETHRSRLMERLDIRDVPGLVRFAVRVGVVSTEE